MNNKIHIIFNPFAAGGRAGDNRSKIIAELTKQLGFGFEFTETGSIYDATDLAREAIVSGGRIIIAVGGDGTFNQVVNGFFEDEILLDPEVRLGIISLGTGQGFAQSLKLPSKLDAQVRLIKDGYYRSADIGLIRFRNNNVVKYFVNEFQFGIGGNLCSISPITKRLLGKNAFGFEATRELLTFKAEKFAMSVNGSSCIAAL